MSDIRANLEQVRLRLAGAARAAGRDPAAITLVAVSKNHPPQAIRTVFEAGQRVFGESYVQEALRKIETLADLKAQWHFIGPIQSNKTKDIARHFDWVHGIDRLKIAERLSAQRPAEMEPLNVCLQVNSSGEASKSGVAPQQLAELAQAVAVLPNLRLRGLMTIPAPQPEFTAQRPPFRLLRTALEALQASGLAIDTLSMGMSDDLEAAILEGATMVRVGTAIFGARPKPRPRR